MGKVTGFIEFEREVQKKLPVDERVKNHNEFVLPLSEEQLKQQGARCMDCGVPFCHWGCPLGNYIPDWNDMVSNGRWHDAIEALHATNNFPEFTGRVCPAPCESACTLGVNLCPVAIKQNEVSIIDRAFDEGWVKAEPPEFRSGKKVAAIGSGPAGLAAAQQLNRAGHEVTLFERADRFGGLLMYGIPDFKLEKRVVQRRIDQMESEGIILKPNTHVGVNYPVEDLKENFDAICLAGGSTKPRDLDVPGRELKGVHFAMEFLPQQNKRNRGDKLDPETDILATGKRVVVLGGGDTGSDCVGTSVRHGAKSIHQFELLPEPPKERQEDNPWPQWPAILRTSTSHEEGGIRDYNILTKSFSGSNGKVEKLHAVRVEWSKDDEGRWQMKELPGTEFEQEVDLVLLAMGFVHPEHDGMLKDLGVELNGRGNVNINEDKMTNIPGIFAAGDMERGQSLIVWAIAAGRAAAKGIDKWLMGETQLP
ncbi:MAG: glutamate synthase subunit beta [Proteobacteria bacterium]|nr:glutamate synthase subunit beta [Pseudomonadota bacterium]